jgi:predicted DNA-binding transcriptional regulator YafY
MRSDRLLSALLLLQAHGRLSGRELSRRLEVSERTIHRDMESLSAAGVPVLALRGAQGGWQLDENWRTQVPGLSESELQGLLMAQPRAAGNPQLARSAERALEKLLAALPTPMRDRAASIRQRLYVDPTGWRSSDSLTALPIVQDALSLDRRIGFRYRRPGYPLHLQTERIVDPLGLIAKGNSWYLFAQTAKGTRTYAVSRIDSPRITDQPSHRPANFDLPAAWNASTDRYQQNLKRYTVTLLVEPGNSEWIILWQPNSVRLAGEDAIGRPMELRSWHLVSITFDHEAEARFFALGLGPRGFVVEPVDLRARVEADQAATASRIFTPCA